MTGYDLPMMAYLASRGLWGQVLNLALFKGCRVKSIMVSNDRLRFADDGVFGFGKQFFQVGQRVSALQYTVFGTDSTKDEPVAGPLLAQVPAQTVPQLFPALVAIVSLEHLLGSGRVTCLRQAKPGGYGS